jgi:UDP-N-acetylglucosamine acyltransferase
VAIHPTAIVDPQAVVDPTAEIGPYAIVDGGVRIGPRTRVMAHAYLTGDTQIGADNVIFPGAGIGHAPMDLKYDGAPTGVRVGDRNTFRENTEIHRGTAPGSVTTIGSDCYLMSHAHVAHNCTLGDHVIMATGAMLGGWCQVAERVFVSGHCVVHQFVRIGRLAMLRGGSRTSRDVPPFALMDGTHVVRGINRVGLRRLGWDAARIRAVMNAYRVLFRVRCNLSEAIARVEASGNVTDEVAELLAFLRASERGVAHGPARGGVADASD